MAFLDATKKNNNSKLSELKKLEDRKLFRDDDEKDYFTRKGDYEFRLTGDIKVKDGKYKGDLTGIRVLKKGDEIYKITNLDVKYQDLIKSIKKGTFDEFVESMFRKKDTIEGSFFDDKLYGFKGDDTINGYGGDDIIRGGRGNDELTGWTGKDTFVFDTALNEKSNVDKITDWNEVKDDPRDSIWLDEDVFKAFDGMKGEGLKKKYFVVAKKAKDDDDHIIYKKGKGKLFYDPDGKGGEDKIQFAKIDNKKALSHNDFDII